MLLLYDIPSVVEFKRESRAVVAGEVGNGELALPGNRVSVLRDGGNRRERWW